MNVQTYDSAEAFLRNVGPVLEKDEPANSLILGICGQLARRSGQYEAVPCLKSVEGERELALAALMTPPHRLLLSSARQHPEPAVLPLVEDLLREGWKVPGVMGRAEVALPMAEAWTAQTGQLSRQIRRQWLYVLREAPQPVPVAGRLRKAVDSDLKRVARWRQAFHLEAFGHADQEQSARVARLRVADGDIYLWEDGQPVSMALKTRPTRNGVSVSLVYTPPEQRGRGYAKACVGSLSRMLLRGGWSYCALFADAANPASNRVYRRLGYRTLAEFHEIEFVDEPQARDG